MAPALDRLAALRPLVLSGRAGRSVTFPNRVFLAPMEGVTDRAFRSVVLDLGGVGGASTEFVRISSMPVTAKVIARELDVPRRGVPVGVQFMAPGPEHLEGTLANMAPLGVEWVDLNFGCPVKRVCGKGAGAALLEDPPLVGQIVAAAVAGTDVPVSAKIRAGVTHDGKLLEILDAAAGAGAAMITLHARLRSQSYAEPARWAWIAAAVAFLREHYPDVILIGNGGVERAEDAHAMLSETGCDGVMIGRAAIANPFIFRECCGDPSATPAEAAAFALRYLTAIDPGTNQRVGRMKQLVRSYRAGGLFEDREEDRLALLRSKDVRDIYRWFEART